MVTEQEMQRLIMSLATSRSKDGKTFTEGDGKKIVAWAEQARVDGHLLELALDGSALIDLDDLGNVVFRRSE